jgi:DNA-binding CsgD family transcriptional regulator
MACRAERRYSSCLGRSMRDFALFRLLERTGDAAFTVDQEGVIRSWNKAAEQLFGYVGADIVGRPCADVLRGADAVGAPVCSADCDVRACVLHGSCIADFDMAVRRGKKTVWVNVSTLVDAEAQTGRALIVHLARDTSVAKAREALIRSAETLGRELIQLAAPKTDPPIGALTHQQTRVLRLLAEGRSSVDIAAHLHISPRTLRTHIHHINRRLHARGRLEAVIYGIRRGLIAAPAAGGRPKRRRS